MLDFLGDYEQERIDAAFSCRLECLRIPGRRPCCGVRRGDEVGVNRAGSWLSWEISKGPGEEPRNLICLLVLEDSTISHSDIDVHDCGLV